MGAARLKEPAAFALRFLALMCQTARNKKLTVGVSAAALKDAGQGFVDLNKLHV